MPVFLAVLGTLAFFFSVILLGMSLGVVGGQIFDHYMGTNLTPIFVMGGLIGIGVDFRKPDTEASFGEELGYALKTAIIWPFIALIGALVAVWFFPETTKAFLAMTGYKAGGMFSLAFWGSVTGCLIKLVVFIPATLIAQVFKR